MYSFNCCTDAQTGSKGVYCCTDAQLSASTEGCLQRPPGVKVSTDVHLYSLNCCTDVQVGLLQIVHEDRQALAGGAHLGEGGGTRHARQTSLHLNLVQRVHGIPDSCHRLLKFLGSRLCTQNIQNGLVSLHGPGQGGENGGGAG